MEKERDLEGGRERKMERQKEGERSDRGRERSGGGRKGR